MLRSVTSRVMWVGRATVFLVGLAVILALVFGAASAALGANGDNFILGVLTNTATDTTRLSGNVSGGPALQVANGETEAGSKGLQLNVAANKPPLAVNATAGKATNLNADKLDGRDFGAFDATRVIGIQGPLPREGTFTSKGGTLIMSASGSGFRGTGQSLTNGRIGMRILLDGQEVGFSEIFANQRNTHQAFISDYRVLENVPAGQHTIRLEAAYFDAHCNVSGSEDPFDYCTTTDLEDFFRVMVIEIPD